MEARFGVLLKSMLYQLVEELSTSFSVCFPAPPVIIKSNQRLITHSMVLGPALRLVKSTLGINRRPRYVSEPISHKVFGLPDINNLPALIGIIPCIIMSIWTTHPLSIALSAVYASYFICYLALGTAPLIFAWLSDLYVSLSLPLLPAFKTQTNISLPI